MTRNRTRFVLAALCALTALAGARPAAADIDFGIRGGAYLEEPDPFVGLELLADLGGTNWFFNPNVEFVFADERDRISLNFDFHYDFATANQSFAYVWAGGGPAIIFRDEPDDPRGDDDDDETDFGVNLLGGVGWRYEGMTPYVQLKLVLSDDSEVVAAVGIRF